MPKYLFAIFFIFASLIEVNAQSQILSLEQFGSKSDGKVLTNGDINSGSSTLNCDQASFTNADLGKTIYIAGAAGNGNTLVAKINNIKTTTSVVLSKAANISVSKASITYGSDCTDAFIAWNNSARLVNGKVILNMQRGTYLTSYNNWLAGIKNITVNGNNCNVICTHGATDPIGSTGSNEGLITPSCFNNLDNNYASFKLMSDNSFGCKIHTVASGKNYITTIKLNDAVGFKPGNWVLIYGLHHEDFGGFPPDPRYFEYVKVTGVNTNEGIVYLDKPLVNTYDERWPEGKTKSGIGAPRILNLNRTNFTTIENIVISDINFLPFNGWNGKRADDSLRNGKFSIFGYINATVKNLTATAAYLGQGKHLVVENATFKYQCEPDKDIDSAFVKNSTIRNFVNAGGINFLSLSNNKFYGEFNASPRVLYLYGNYFSTQGANSISMVSIGFNKGTNYVKVGSNTWNCSDSKKTTLFSEPGSCKMTVGAVIDRNTVSIPFMRFQTDRNSRQVVPGSIGYTSAGNKIEVTSVYQYDADNIAVSGTFSKSASVGDVFVFTYLPAIDIVDKQIKAGQFSKNLSVFKSHTFVYKLNTVDKN